MGQSETGLSGSEFALTIADLLSGSRTSDDLQTELFDLLGFDRIELIQELLEHRREIVDSYHLNKKVSRKKFSTYLYKLATDRFRTFVYLLFSSTAIFRGNSFFLVSIYLILALKQWSLKI